MSKQTFGKTSGAGKFGEQTVLNHLKSLDIEARKNPNSKDIKWDIEFFHNNEWYSIEIKYDKMESETGNIAIEYYNTKKASPSGILATTSDFWVFVLQNPLSIWLAKTSELLKFFNDTKPYRDITCGGDDNSAMKLYKREDILSTVFTQIDNLSSKQFIEILNVKKY